MLDLESVRLFVLTVELGNLTRAAEAAGTVQPVVSQRLKSLEADVGRKLLERSPRYLRLTEEGGAFLAKARVLLAAHDDAARFADRPSLRFAIGASDHALGTHLEQVLRFVRSALPTHAAIEVHLGLSQHIRETYNEGSLDVAIIRREAGGPDGEVLGSDPLGWRSVDGITETTDTHLPLALLEAPCGVRAAAIRCLDQANRPWREAFIGGGCVALLAAARAGLGIAPMGRIASGLLPDCGARLGLPSLPPSEIVMFARTTSPAAASAVRALESAIGVALQKN